MSTRKAAARRFEEDIANVGVPPKGNQAPPQGNQVHPQEKTQQHDQVLVIPLAMTDGEIS